jgi:deoxyribose-phosphate aldolase
MRDIAEAADERPVKALFDARLITREEKILVCQLALDSGIKYVCPALDVYSVGVTVEDIALLRETLGKDFGIKATGAISSGEQALKLIEAGATRIGALAGVDLLPVN